MHLSVYSGYVKWSGLKGTTITLPHGLIGALYGDISAHKNDASSLQMGNLNVALMHLQTEATAGQPNE